MEVFRVGGGVQVVVHKNQWGVSVGATENIGVWNLFVPTSGNRLVNTL
jgi:hypothetical protein